MDYKINHPIISTVFTLTLFFKDLSLTVNTINALKADGELKRPPRVSNSMTLVVEY